MLGIRTWGGRMEGENESTELRRHPWQFKSYLTFSATQTDKQIDHPYNIYG